MKLEILLPLKFCFHLEKYGQIELKHFDVPCGPFGGFRVGGRVQRDTDSCPGICHEKKYF